MTIDNSTNNELVVSDKQLRKDLTMYRIFAWITGIMLLILTANMVYKYGYIRCVDPQATLPPFTQFIPVVHGLCYMLYLLFCGILGIRVGWSFPKLIVTLIAGTIPFVSFFVEHRRTREVRNILASHHNPNN